jgi:hypothetical protein
MIDFFILFMFYLCKCEEFKRYFSVRRFRSPGTDRQNDRQTEKGHALRKKYTVLPASKEIDTGYRECIWNIGLYIIH